jgi:hypothetical protein
VRPVSNDGFRMPDCFFLIFSSLARSPGCAFVLQAAPNTRNFCIPRPSEAAALDPEWAARSGKAFYWTGLTAGLRLLLSRDDNGDASNGCGTSNDATTVSSNLFPACKDQISSFLNLVVSMPIPTPQCKNP